jgi:energy-coupling factor transporter ATP-binding protein EcfA2
MYDAFAVLMHMRGQFVAHASAALIGGGAVLFIGDSGLGKSTTAAALERRGHPFITDDIAALSLPSSPGESVFVAPAFPQVKLTPSALHALNIDPEGLSLAYRSSGKYIYPATSPFPVDPVPVHAIYLLDEDWSLSLHPMNRTEAFLALSANAYLIHLRDVYGVDLLAATGTTARYFAQCAEIVRRVPMYRLYVRDALEDLPHIAGLIIENTLALAR